MHIYMLFKKLFEWGMVKRNALRFRLIWTFLRMWWFAGPARWFLIFPKHPMLLPIRLVEEGAKCIRYRMTYIRSILYYDICTSVIGNHEEERWRNLAFRVLRSSPPFPTLHVYPGNNIRVGNARQENYAYLYSICNMHTCTVYGTRYLTCLRDACQYSN